MGGIALAVGIVAGVVCLVITGSVVFSWVLNFVDELEEYREQRGVPATHKRAAKYVATKLGWVKGK